MTYRRRPIAGAAVVLVLVFGCRQKMADQPRFEPYEGTSLFQDSMAMRHPVAGTVPRAAELDRRYRLERLQDGTPLQERTQVVDSVLGEGEPAGLSGIPVEITRNLLERGRQRFDIYCSPCHGRVGDGSGIIVERGLRKPPSFHTDRLRRAPPSHFYEVIADGYGAMYSYASRVKPSDRWAIAAYIRALQLSRHADVSHAPPDEPATP